MASSGGRRRGSARHNAEGRPRLCSGQGKGEEGCGQRVGPRWRRVDRYVDTRPGRPQTDADDMSRWVPTPHGTPPSITLRSTSPLRRVLLLRVHPLPHDVAIANAPSTLSLSLASAGSITPPPLLSCPTMERRVERGRRRVERSRRRVAAPEVEEAPEGDEVPSPAGCGRWPHQRAPRLLRLRPPARHPPPPYPCSTLPPDPPRDPPLRPQRQPLRRQRVGAGGEPAAHRPAASDGRPAPTGRLRSSHVLGTTPHRPAVRCVPLPPVDEGPAPSVSRQPPLLRSAGRRQR